MQFVPIQDIRLINEIPVLELIFTFLLVLYSNSTFVQMMDTHFNRIKWNGIWRRNKSWTNMSV